MTHDAFGRIDWFTSALNDVPHLILHMRAQAVPSMQASSEPRVSGSKERAIAPLNIDPLDEADDVWGRVCSLAVDFAERSGKWRGLPDELDRQWLVATSSQFSVVGFSTTDPDRIYSDVIAVTRYLREHAYTLTLGAEYSVPVDELVASIQGARARYPGAAFRPHRHRCPRCLRNGVVPIYSQTGQIQQLRCERCGASRTF
ncbi:hypothetical protein MUN78_07035 [Leucobacter allii]|uniref:Uncharacterized protein n=1 Tax=Leucobacter allii TaxID=2932247 RepID=A0ABY4FQK5_9MICO|nr:hypothetical protein [Leucobacter allii]UOQ58571.1 hypothetical protein MUN78_07035 [Leucobacter allii]